VPPALRRASGAGGSTAVAEERTDYRKIVIFEHYPDGAEVLKGSGFGISPILAARMLDVGRTGSRKCHRTEIESWQGAAKPHRGLDAVGSLRRTSQPGAPRANDESIRAVRESLEPLVPARG